MRRNCIIIGSGLGGLSSGIILAKNGYRVSILEKEAQVGGCLQCFVRKGVRFETGMHFIGSAAPGQTIDRLLRYMGVGERLALSRLDPTGYDVISLQGERFEIASGKDAFVEKLAARFPQERTALEHYFDLVSAIAGGSSSRNLELSESSASLYADYQLRSVDDVLGGLVKDERLRNVLVGNLPLYAGRRGETPFSSHAFIVDFYNQSAFRIVGGSDRLAQLMREELERLGGRVLTRCRAAKIVCDDEKAIAVEDADGTRYDADLVLSDLHPARTLELIDSHLLRPAYRRRIADLQNTIGGFAVYLAFKPESVPYMNHNFFSYSAASPWDCEDYDARTWPKGFLYMHLCERAQQQWATSGVILSYMHFADVARWQDTRPGHRGSDYEDFKRRHAERLIAAVEAERPELRGNIAAYYTSTPLTYRDYTGTEGGSMYGVAKNIRLGPAARVPHKTRIPNLFLVGQNVNSHGIMGTLVGTLVACADIVGEKTLFQQINESINE